MAWLPLLLSASAVASGCATRGGSARVETAALKYASSIDGTKPLRADAMFLRDGKRKPLLVLMHGYSGGRQAMADDLKAWAPRGVFALAPDMRGCGDSGGTWDSGGLDVHDIVDAVLAAIKRWPNEIDAGNLSIAGYSGGGGNAIACMARFPDLFRNYVSFFGISDYGGWHRSRGRPDCNERMEAVLGGPPDALPDVYLSRNMIPAAANARCGRLWFFWDEEEQGCPPDMVQAFIDKHRSAGLRNASAYVSRKGDAHRWIHGYRRYSPGLAAADEVLAPAILKPEGVRHLPDQGRLVVPGYVVTRRFQVWVEDGTRGQVTVEYDLRGASPVVRVVENAGRWKVRAILASPLAALP